MIYKILGIALIHTLFITPNFAQETTESNTVTLCNTEQQYAHKDLASYFPAYKELPTPDKSPTFKGGEKKIEKFIDKNLDLGDLERHQIIPVYVHFVVNCNGEAGEFEFSISEIFKDREFYEKQLLTLFMSLPQNWSPAVKNGVAVDTHQIMSFSINISPSDPKSNGIDNLSY
ncbi:MAG: hypothetical protein H6598_03475 [Flavobacteriales bacterium]|nr:hypothetical protein [Flavobacteriales bacterium]